MYPVLDIANPVPEHSLFHRRKDSVEELEQLFARLESCVRVLEEPDYVSSIDTDVERDQRRSEWHP